MALSTPDEQRVLLKTLTSKDAAMTLALLHRAGLRGHACRTAAELLEETTKGAGALLLAEETLTDPSMEPLADFLRSQPPWSDLPVLIIARAGAISDAVLGALDITANITVIERPLRVFALVSSVRSAIRARNRQYELRELLEGLRKADQRKTEFLATLAHELRNPLAPLRNTLTILTMKPHTAEAAQPHYEMMGRQLRHMARLIDDLMEISRITRGKIELRFEPVILARVIEGAVELSRPAIESGRHRLRVAVPDTTWMVRGDAVRLTQVFSNLLNNAAKYTPPEGVIEIEASCTGTHALVRVRDTGIGIPADMLDSVFEMFMQIGDDGHSQHGGLGIGLTLVKSLVELHGGSIRAHSGGRGLGTEIAIELPLLSAVAVPDNDNAAQISHGALAEEILIVDDNRDAADSLSALLKSIGAKTHVAYNAADALGLLALHRPAVAIADIGMPGINGCEFAQHVRGNPRDRNILLIALTGWGQSDARQRIAGAGFDYHFLKPADINGLIGAIRAGPRAGAAGAAGAISLSQLG